MAMVVKELETPNTEMKKPLANTLEAVQEVTQAGPNSFHRVTMDTCTVGITACVLAFPVIDGGRPLVV